MEYLVAAYAVFWAVSFALVFSIYFRQRRIRADLEALHVMLEEEPLVRD
jgi:hypothetical protein